MTTYRDRRMARADRLEEWADKRQVKADQAHEQADRMAAVIPFGQPILVGHYSEGRDRRYRDRIHGTYGKAIEHQHKADEMARKAESIRSAADRAIYSDDIDAIERLEEKLADLEAQRGRIKAYNASCKKGTRDLGLLDDAQREKVLSVAQHMPSSLGKQGQAPGFMLTNLSGTIATTRKRLEGMRSGA